MKKEKREKKKLNWKQWIPVLFFVMIGAGCGIMIARFIDLSAESGRTLGQQLMIMGGLILAMYLCSLVHVVVHEAGHLVFGLLTGYEFTSFRIGSFMWIKEDGRLKRKSFSLAGTGGQCLMSPPDLVNGKMPVFLYNMGGSIANLIVSLLCGILYALIGKVSLVSTILMILVLVGIGSAVVNGIPMKLGVINNDGCNAVALKRNPEAASAFWFQMKVNGEISKGKRLKEMPDEWFVVPSDEEMKDSLIAVKGVFCCNRLMDEQNFQEADRLMEHLLSLESGIVGVHRNLMICDRIYCELIGENRDEIIDSMWTKDLKKFMKSMKNFPSVIRTQYAYQLLAKDNRKKAEKIKTQFEKTAEKYPYPSDMQSERELIEYANTKIQ